VKTRLLAGRFGPPARLRDPLAATDTVPRILTITAVNTSASTRRTPNAGQLVEPGRSDFNPIIVLGSKAYGFSDAPLVKQ